MLEINQPKYRFPTVNLEVQRLPVVTVATMLAAFAASNIGRPSTIDTCEKGDEIDACTCHTGGLAMSVVLESKCRSI